MKGFLSRFTWQLSVVFFLGFSLEKQHEDMIRKNWELIKQHGGYKKSFEHGVLWAKHQDSKWGYSDWQEWADSANQKAFFWGIGVGWMLQMRCKTLQCPNFMIYLGTPRTRNAESTRNRKIYNSCRKKHCWLRGLIPPKKRIWIMAMLWYPAKRYYLFVSMSVHLYMAKRDRRYPRLNHGWFLSFQISRWGLPAIQTGLYNETPMNVRKIHPQLQSLLVNTYSCFYHFFFVISFTLQ